MIAVVAMMPIISIQILGALYYLAIRKKQSKGGVHD